MRKVSLFLVLLAIGMIAFGGTAFAWNFGSAYSSNSAYSSISSYTYTPTASSYASSTAFASTCSFCGTAEVKTFTSSNIYGGGTSFSSSASAYSFASSIEECNEPETPCEDLDNDDLCDDVDRCLDTPPDVTIDEFGCCYDDDNDGICNENDLCAGFPLGIPFGTWVDEFGCPDPCATSDHITDIDNDGVADCRDDCLDTAPDVTVDDFGCECEDTDLDGICDEDDDCKQTEEGDVVDQWGCSLEQACPCSDVFIPGGPGLYQDCIVGNPDGWARSVVSTRIIDPGLGCFSAIAGQAKCGSPVGAKCEPGHPNYDQSNIGTICPEWAEPLYDICFEFED
jgi:hypothetical protein